MKKLIIGLFASVLMSTGLVAFTGSSATADPYPGTVATNCHASGQSLVRKNRAPKSKLRVSTAGNGTPMGSLRATYKRLPGSSKSVTRGYPGGTKSFRGPRLRKAGRYKVTVKYLPSANSVFKPCRDSYRLRVR